MILNGCGRGLAGRKGKVASALVRGGRHRTRLGGTASGQLLALSDPSSRPRGKWVCQIGLCLERRLLCCVLGLCLWLWLLVRYYTCVLLHCHTLTVLSLNVLEAPRPMAVLRGRRLLAALAVFIGHLGRGPGPRGRLDVGDWGQASKGRRLQTTAATSSGRYKLVVLQELSLVLGEQQGSQEVQSRRIGTQGNRFGEGGGWRRGASSSGSAGTNAVTVAVAVAVNADATPGGDGLVCVFWFSGCWPAVHEDRTALLPRMTRGCGRSAVKRRADSADLHAFFCRSRPQTRSRISNGRSRVMTVGKKICLGRRRGGEARRSRLRRLRSQDGSGFS